uniref:Uncharacterized protein n=1 Tax=Salix viminalis TaxID=40686 RepID=A0A6N2LHL7_SALVM
MSGGSKIEEVHRLISSLAKDFKQLENRQEHMDKSSATIIAALHQDLTGIRGFLLGLSKLLKRVVILAFY